MTAAQVKCIVAYTISQERMIHARRKARLKGAGDDWWPTMLLERSQCIRRDSPEALGSRAVTMSRCR